MKKEKTFYLADEKAPENQCKYRIHKLPIQRQYNRAAAFLPHTDTLFVVERKVSIGPAKVWMKRRQFFNLQDAQNYVTRKAVPLAQSHH